MRNFLGFLIGLFAVAPNLEAQKLLVVNGGLFGGGAGAQANVGIYDLTNNSYAVMDTIRTTSVQDAWIENDSFAYIAAQDSIIKYNLYTRQRLAATRFGSTSTIRLKTYGNYLVVGNWYGSTNNNFRFFDKNTLAFVDSIPQISKGATDFVIVGNKAIIAQNKNDASTNFKDSLGYVSVVNLDTRQWLYNDTLSNNGSDVGRLVWHTSPFTMVMASINAESNTISYYNPNTRAKSTQTASVDLQTLSTGNCVYPADPRFQSPQTVDNYYLPANNVVINYNIMTNMKVQDSVLVHGQTTPFTSSFSYTHNPQTDKFYLAKIFSSNQPANRGVIYNQRLTSNTRDSIGTFPVGNSPEVLVLFNLPQLVGVAETSAVIAAPALQIFPNPATEYVQVRIPNLAQPVQAWLRIYDQIGQVQTETYTTLSENTPVQLQIQQLAAGMYWVQYLADGEKPVYYQLIKY
jgi:Secretion system C-terminal sorting domain